MRAIDARWDRELPGVSRDHYLLLGPVPDTARCAGTSDADDVACARSWDEPYGRTWIARRLTMTKSGEPGNVAHTLSS